jgi:hypothetical protein
VLAEGWPQLERGGFTVAAFEQHVSGPFIKSVTERNLRNRGVARWALTRVSPRGRGLGASLGMSFWRNGCCARATSRICRRGLQVIATSTELVSDRVFRVSPEFVGS